MLVLVNRSVHYVEEYWDCRQVKCELFLLKLKINDTKYMLFKPILWPIFVCCVHCTVAVVVTVACIAVVIAIFVCLLFHLCFLSLDNVKYWIRTGVFQVTNLMHTSLIL